MEILKKAFKGFVTRLPFILLLNLIMLLTLGVLLLICGPDFFSPYIKTLAGKILSVSDVLIFLTLFSVCGFTLEFLLRCQIQDRILGKEKSWSKAVAVVLPAVLFVLLQLNFGVVGVVYGLLCGVLLSLIYLRKQDWLTFSLWHMMWGFIIVPTSMALCVFMDGQIRNDFLFAYKKRHIIKEKMYYQENWGWVDTVHYRPDHYDHLMKAVNSAQETGEAEIVDGWITPLQIKVGFSAKYQFKKPETEIEKWALVTGMMMNFMRLNETVQEESPWYHGNQLSAWQFDDMSSCLLCCLDRFPGDKQVTGEETKNINQLLLKWEETGESIVGLKMKEDESWNLLEEGKRNKLRALVDAQAKNWSVVKTYNSNE